MASCVCLAFDDPRLDPTSPLAERLRLANLILIVMFSIEAALKIIATGLASYLKSGWNLLDMLVLLTSMISLLPIGGSWASMARLLRVIRQVILFHDFVFLIIFNRALLIYIIFIAMDTHLDATKAVTVCFQVAIYHV